MSLSRRELLKTSAFAVAGSAIGPDALKTAAPSSASLVEQWGVFVKGLRSATRSSILSSVLVSSRVAERSK
jgi:hypothetical protein